MFYGLKLNAGNDTNGNPRRGWLIYDAKGRNQKWVEEGYRGHGALKMVGFKEGENLIVLAELSVPFSELRAARKI